ncbi:MAG: DNA topoisomerase 3 [bacterium]|nr:DNA topoisomerase 3 [bacterium]
MKHKLIIAEKPSMAQSIARALNITERKNGYIQNEEYIITWCIGHLAGLADASAYDEKYAKWSYKDLPIIPRNWQLALNSGKEEQFNIVKSLMLRDDVTELINACDAGREGELIFRFVYSMAGCKKPFKRLWISSLENSAIREGFQNLRDGSEYDNLYRSGLCRAKADWLVGINATRLYSTLYHKTLNIGRVQTPTLALLVLRDSKIASFKKEKYYTVEIGDTKTKAISERFSDKDEAENIKTACDNSQAVCVSVVKEKKTERAPKLFDLTTLQREANRFFGYTAKQTLDYAQSLYENKLITYPRTDSRYLTEDMADAVTAVIHLSAKHPPFSNCADFTPDTFYLFNNKKVTDHHAIIPTRQIEGIRLNELPNGERSILQLIMCKLLCAVNAPYEYETVTAEFMCGNTKFTAKGKNVLSEGWKGIERLFRSYIGGDNSESENNGNVDIAEGQKINVTASINEGYTSPPKAYTEDTLLSAMETAGAKETTDEAERKGLGTPATRAGIIEKLVQTGFIERKGKSLVPTRDGISLASILPETLTSPLLTAEWENHLAEIAKGEYSGAEFMAGIENLVSELIRKYSFIAEDKKDIFKTPREVIGKCPRCGSDVYESKYNFCCSNKDCAFVMWKNDRFFTNKKKELTKKIASDLLIKGKSKVKGFYSEKTDKTYDATIVLADTGGKYVKFEKRKRR